MRSSRRFAPYFLGLFFLVLVLGVSVFRLLYTWQVQPFVDSRLLLQHEILPEITNDIRLIAGEPELAMLLPRGHRPPPLTNAGMLLDPLIYPDDEHKNIPRKTRQYLARLEAEWLDNHRWISRLKFDIGFLSQLGAYDHWSPKIEHSAPDTHNLLAAAKLRLMLGARPKDAQVALAEVIKLAQLMIGSNNYTIVHAGLTVLDLQRRAGQYYLNRGWISEKNEALSKLPLRKAQRLLSVLPSYLNFWSSEKQMREFFIDQAEALPGFCAIVSSKLGEQYHYQRWYEASFPFEHSWGPTFNTMNEVQHLGLKLCPESTMKTIESGDYLMRPGPAVLNRIPYVRHLFLTWTSSHAQASFQPYLNTAGKPASAQTVSD